jgi:hypothetical protein
MSLTDVSSHMPHGVIAVSGVVSDAFCIPRLPTTQLHARRDERTHWCGRARSEQWIVAEDLFTAGARSKRSGTRPCPNKL